jgi:signal peptidase II
MGRTSYILFAAGIGTLVLVGDELLKQFVRSALTVCDVSRLGTCASVDVFGPLRLVRAENAGSALGFHQGWAVWLVLAAAGLGLIPLYARQLRACGALAALAVGLQAGGALGNLLDRVALGSATDMLTTAQGLVWNVADLGLALGTLLATTLLLVRVATDRPRLERGVARLTST